MKSIVQTAVVISFIYVFALTGAAQETAVIRLGTPTPNELEGYEFQRSGKLKELRIGISTKEDVIKIFGSACGTLEKGCDYDENWRIFVSYINETYTRTVSRDNRTQMFVIAPEYMGKIHTIQMSPKQRLSFSAVVFPDKLKKVSANIGTVFSKDDKLIARYDFYKDEYGLQYKLFDSVVQPGANPDRFKDRQPGDLMYIFYTIPAMIRDKMFVEQKPDNK